MTELKLIALDEDDLKIVSAHLQDAVTKVGDLAYLPREKRFAALVNRFDWVAAAKGERPFKRRRAALRFEQVTAARILNIALGDKTQVLNLLAVQFAKAAEGDPGGQVSLVFAGDAAIQLDVQFIETELKDLGAVWSTGSKPEHADET